MAALTNPSWHFTKADQLRELEAYHAEAAQQGIPPAEVDAWYQAELEAHAERTLANRTAGAVKGAITRRNNRRTARHSGLFQHVTRPQHNAVGPTAAPTQEVTMSKLTTSTALRAPSAAPQTSTTPAPASTAPALKGAEPVRECGLTLTQFRELARALECVIGGKTTVAMVKEFSTGSLGWYLGDKLTVKVGDHVVRVQVGMNMTIIGSKPDAE